MATTSELLQALNEGVAANTAAINTLTAQMAGTQRSGLSRKLSVLPSSRYVTAFPVNSDGLVENGSSFTAPANGLISFSFATSRNYGYAVFAVMPPGATRTILVYKFLKSPVGGTQCVVPLEKGSRITVDVTVSDAINGHGEQISVQAATNVFVYSNEEA